MHGAEEIRMDRCRYGASALWTVRDGITGSSARSLCERVGLFFAGGESTLLFDLSGARVIDSAGAEALVDCRGRHRGFRTVGSPAAWQDMPLPVRTALSGLDSAPDLETALADALPADPRRFDGEQRRHARIPLQLPVQLVLDGASTIVALRDISRGGVRLDRVPADWLREMHPDRTIGILGLEVDPLGRELMRGLAPGPVPAVTLHTHPGSGLGARFLHCHPPV